MRLTRRTTVLLGLAVMPFAHAGAQAVVSGNVAWASAYVFRGVTNTNRAVLQPDVTLAMPVGAGIVTIGAWTSIEPTRYDGAADISAVYGQLPGPAFTQYSAWVEYGRPLFGADVTAGATAYTYPDVAGLADDFNTVEWYASIALPIALSPTLAAWHDVAAVRGAYFEGSLSQEFDLRLAPLAFGILAGLNVGQGPDEGGAQAYFARRGLTHLDFSASTSFDAGGLSVAPLFHVIRSFDPLARVTSPTGDRGIKSWLGVTISWSSDRGPA